MVTKSTWWSKVVALGMGAPAVVAGVLDQLPVVRDNLAGLSDLGVSSSVVLLAVGAGALALYLLSQRAERAAVANVRQGRDSGPI